MRPYKTRDGRRRYLTNAATNIRQKLVALDGTKATFECLSGHKVTHDYGKGPVPRRIPASSLQRMAAYWGLGGDGRGFVYGWCQKCQNLIDKE